ncbi:MAG: hypothetical protein IT204_02990 [Fimbriimonadaceae bacterium]|nr:hypothetical protein [Fimbriimonadaceae bacterium]
MAALLSLVLTALAGLSLLGGDLSAALTAQLRRDFADARQVQATVTAPAEPGSIGHLEQVTVTLASVDARRLPLAALAPLPRPRAPQARLGQLLLTAREVSLDQLQAAEIEFRAEDLVYDLTPALTAGELRLTRVGRQRLTVTFRDGDLDAYARDAFAELSDPRLTFEHGQLVARAKIPLIFAAFNASITGRLVVEEHRCLMLRDAVLETGRVELSDELRASVLERLNPLLDLDAALHFPVPVRWDEVVVGEGQAVLSGEVLPLPPWPSRGDFNPRERYLR